VCSLLAFFSQANPKDKQASTSTECSCVKENNAMFHAVSAFKKERDKVGIKMKLVKSYPASYAIP